MTLANFLNYEFKIPFIGERVNRRINRSRYILYKLLGYLPFILLILLNFLLPQSEGLLDMILAYIGLFTIFLGYVLGFILSIKRLHDINLSGWLILLDFFPLINVIFILYIILTPGTLGENNYGTPTLSSQKWEIILATTILLSTFLLPLTIFSLMFLGWL